MKKYECKWIDLSPTWTLDNNKKMNELIDRLNELGQEGWVILTGFEIAKYAVFMREVSD